MTLEEIIKELQNNSTYNFLNDNPHLGDHNALITVGGSHAYGTNTKDSDLDIRGVALNSKEDILLGKDFKTFDHSETDTVIYSFNQFIKLLRNVNPNTIEMLGNREENILYTSKIGNELLSNRNMFLSKIAVNSFGGYANQQLRRLDNKAVRTVSQEEREQHILETIKFASVSFAQRYFDMSSDSINLYVDKAIQEGYFTEIFMDVSLKHYPLRDYVGMWNELKTIVSSYSKLGKRNQHAADHKHLGKHMMHLIRLYLMAFDILEKKEIITYREKEHDYLMSIRNGVYLDKDDKPIPEFFDIVSKYETRLKYDAENTDLPATPNQDAINEFLISVNERIVYDKV